MIGAAAWEKRSTRVRVKLTTNEIIAPQAQSTTCLLDLGTEAMQAGVHRQHGARRIHHPRMVGSGRRTLVFSWSRGSRPVWGSTPRIQFYQQVPRAGTTPSPMACEDARSCIRTTRVGPPLPCQFRAADATSYIHRASEVACQPANCRHHSHRDQLPPLSGGNLVTPLRCKPQCFRSSAERLSRFVAEPSAPLSANLPTDGLRPSSIDPSRRRVYLIVLSPRSCNGPRPGPGPGGDSGPGPGFGSRFTRHTLSRSVRPTHSEHRIGWPKVESCLPDMWHSLHRRQSGDPSPQMRCPARP